MQRVFLYATASALLLAAPSAPAQSPPAYHLEKTVTLGAPDRWDYVVFDPQSQRVFVAHGDRVTVVNGRDGTILGHVEGMPGASHGIGISTANGRGYTNDGQAGEAVSFDLQTLRVTNRIPAGKDSDAITVEPITGHVFVANGASRTMTVIDPRTDSQIASIDVGGRLEYAVGDNGKVYVNVLDKNVIARIDAATNQVDAQWPLAGCVTPHGLAIDSRGRRLFSTCVNGVMTILNAENGALVAAMPIGKDSDAAAFDPGRKLVFSSSNEGTISVIAEKDPDHFVSLGSFPTAFSGRTMAIDPDSGRLFVAAADYDPNALQAPGRPRPIPGSLKLLFFDPS